jgi:hypothetical protein
VIEADEYDTAFFDKRSKFVHYRAQIAILNNLEFDHADIFPDIAAIQRQFHHLVRTVPGSGRLIVNAEDNLLAEVLAMGAWTPVTTFGIERGDWRARHGPQHDGVGQPGQSGATESTPPEARRVAQERDRTVRQSVGIFWLNKYKAAHFFEFFGWLEAHADEVLSRDAEAVRHVVTRCCRLKADVVEFSLELQRIAGGKQAQVGWGSQIRNYVLQPYQMVKDLRSGVESGNVAAVLDGDIDQFMEGYLRWKRASAGDSGDGGAAVPVPA